MTHATQLPPPFMAKLYDLDTDAALAHMRNVAPPVDAAQAQAWFEESRRATGERWGVATAEAYLTKVNTFLNAHPTLRSGLEATGHRYHPAVVEGLIEHIRKLG